MVGDEASLVLCRCEVGFWGCLVEVMSSNDFFV